MTPERADTDDSGKVENASCRGGENKHGVSEVQVLFEKGKKTDANLERRQIEQKFRGEGDTQHSQLKRRGHVKEVRHQERENDSIS